MTAPEAPTHTVPVPHPLPVPAKRHPGFIRPAPWLRQSGLLWILALLAATLASSTRAHAAPLIVDPPDDLDALAGTSARLHVRAQGLGALTYQWWKDDAPLPGRTSPTLEIRIISPSDAGAYVVAVRDSTGTVSSRPARLTVDTPTLLMPLQATWRTSPAPAGDSADLDWTKPGFDDANWPEGRAPFFNTTQALPIPKTTPLARLDLAGRTIRTHRFRGRFTFPSHPGGHRHLMISNFVSDGAVYFLNGRELGRLRMPAGPFSAGTPAAPAARGRPALLAVPADSLIEGENLLAVDLHQSGSNEPPHAVFALALLVSRAPPALPDLSLWAPSLMPRLEEWTFGPGDCEVREGLIQAGLRRLLRFATETRNVGTADLVMASPVNNPEFVYHPCHRHYHFNDYVRHRLVDPATGKTLIDGGKASFALEDSRRWHPAAPGSPVYSAERPGIQRGWADVYGHVVPGQWLDVTGLAPGNYVLELELDPLHKLPDLDRSNNTARYGVEIPGAREPCTQPPPNDAFHAATLVPAEGGTILSTTRCASFESGEPPIPSSKPTQSLGPSVWFRWTPRFSRTVNLNTYGSNFDTLLAVYTGTDLRRLEPIAINDDDGPAGNSRILLNAVAGTEYRISVEGFYSLIAERADEGDVVLNVISGEGGSDIVGIAVEPDSLVLTLQAPANPGWGIETSTDLRHWGPAADFVPFMATPGALGWRSYHPAPGPQFHRVVAE